MNDDFMDYLGYKIFIGEGKDAGWETDYFDHDREEEETETMDLGEMIQDALEPLANFSFEDEEEN